MERENQDYANLSGAMENYGNLKKMNNIEFCKLEDSYMLRMNPSLDSMKAINYLKYLNDKAFIPCSKEGAKIGKASNSELRRWLEKGSVNINNKNPKPNDEIELPIKKLVFFEKSHMKTTMIYDNYVWLQDYANKIVKNFHRDWLIEGFEEDNAGVA